MVERLREQSVGKVVVDILKDLKDDRQELSWQQWRPVVIRRVYPAVHEVLVAVRKTLSLKVEVLRFLLIEQGPPFG